MEEPDRLMDGQKWPKSNMPFQHFSELGALEIQEWHWQQFWMVFYRLRILLKECSKKMSITLATTIFHKYQEKMPYCIMDRFFLNNEESESCLSCMWNTYWPSSSSLPNMKAIHWIKVTYGFEKRLTKRLKWDFRDNLHEMSNPVFWGKYFKMSSAEIFTQHAKS